LDSEVIFYSINLLNKLSTHWLKMHLLLALVFSLLYSSTRGFAPSVNHGLKVVPRSVSSPYIKSLSMADRVQILEKESTASKDETTLALSEGGKDDDDFDAEYKKGIKIIAIITLLNASLAPIWHTVFASGNGPPPLFLNAIVSIVALLGLLAGGSLLDSSVESSAALADSSDREKWSMQSFRGGMELGLWKGLGTTCHIYGMSLTTANHGAFLLQLTTLIVPVIQGLQGEKIPNQIKLAVGLALAGIIAFTQDPTGVSSDVALDAAQIHLGDSLVLGAAFFYSLYDIQTFYWGREVPRTELVTIKIGFQALLSVILCTIVAREDVMQYINSEMDLNILIPVVLWSGLIVNALATFLQVGGMQSVGPTRAQTIFASQPLWASILNYVFIGEIMGLQGFVGGGAFLGALVLAATAEAPRPKLKSAE
jgi:drug/metabolite transporter (DMT)-like permease